MENSNNSGSSVSGMGNSRFVLGIDPGTYESAYVLINGLKLYDFGKVVNQELINIIREIPDPMCEFMAIEMPASYGMAVGREVFATCLWAGRFYQYGILRYFKPYLVYRKAKNYEDDIPGVATEICKDQKANDSNIRKAIIDMYPPEGGGSIPQIGTKKQPGPLYGVKADVWSALAVALTFQAGKPYKEAIGA